MSKICFNSLLKINNYSQLLSKKKLSPFALRLSLTFICIGNVRVCSITERNLCRWGGKWITVCCSDGSVRWSDAWLVGGQRTSTAGLNEQQRVRATGRVPSCWSVWRLICRSDAATRPPNGRTRPAPGQAGGCIYSRQTHCASSRLAPPVNGRPLSVNVSGVVSDDDDEGPAQLCSGDAIPINLADLRRRREAKSSRQDADNRTAWVRVVDSSVYRPSDPAGLRLALRCFLTILLRSSSLLSCRSCSAVV